MERRQHPRFTVEYAGSFLGEDLTAPGMILDLSFTGCRARSVVPVSHGTLLRVLIDVPRYSNPLQVILAVVRWSNGQEFGLEFTGLPPDDQLRLHELILSIKPDEK